MTQVDTNPAGLPLGAPELRTVTQADIKTALEKGWADFKAAPQFGLFFGAFYTIGGLVMYWITQSTGQSYWLILAALGFPLIGPFAAVGLYEVSRRLETGEALDWGGVLGVMRRESGRQIPSLAVLVMGVFLVWVFLAHMMFALFMGKMTMVNVFSSFEIFATTNGITFLIVGSAVGAGLAMLLFSLTVFGMPMLLDREVDYITAITTSFEEVMRNQATMLTWGAVVAGALIAAMLPFFLGLLVVMPVLGHATWHLYRTALS
ncbi:MAG: DUF2189 domain-containing protein [Pseudomonadota bacterium]